MNFNISVVENLYYKAQSAVLLNAAQEMRNYSQGLKRVSTLTNSL